MLSLLAILRGGHKSDPAHGDQSLPASRANALASGARAQSGAGSVVVGTTGVGQALGQDREACAQETELTLETLSSTPSTEGVLLEAAPSALARGSFDDGAKRQSRALSMDSLPAQRGGALANRPGEGRETGRSSPSGLVKKSVSFSQVDDVKILSEPDLTKALSEVDEAEEAFGHDEETPRWGREEESFSRMRGFVWSMHRWQDVFQPEGGKTDKSGVKRFSALLARVYASEPVQRASEIFSEARMWSASETRNPLSPVALPPGMLFSKADLKELDKARTQLVELLNSLKPELESIRMKSNWVQRTSDMNKLTGAGIPHNQALLPVEVLDSPQQAVVAPPESWQLSFGGDERAATRAQVPVLFWGEFLAGMHRESNQGVEGLNQLMFKQKVQVAVINDPGQHQWR